METAALGRPALPPAQETFPAIAKSAGMMSSDKNPQQKI
jgi:hypothetical protein